MHDHDSGAGLRSVDDVVDGVLAACHPLPSIELPLLDAVGCTLASDLTSEHDLPSFASSAMDGFAVRAADVASADAASTVTLRVVGRASIGHAPDVTVGLGEAVRIATGSPIPSGADTIVPIEDCQVGHDAVEVLFARQEGAFVRPAAEDVRAGDTIVTAGRRIGAPEIALVAAAGIARVPVVPKPRVAVISTGDELVDLGSELRYGQVYDSNAYTIAAAVREAGGESFIAGHVDDDPDALRDLVQNNVSAADVFVSSGGVSVGDRDPVKAAFKQQLDFYKVAMQPGMPQGFGVLEGLPFFCLPGNPVAVFVSMEVFVRPALLKMAGRRSLFRPMVTAASRDRLTGPKGKATYVRVVVDRGEDGFWCESTGDRGSNLISTVTRANGLAVLPPGIDVVEPGGQVQVMVFRSLEDR